MSCASLVFNLLSSVFPLRVLARAFGVFILMVAWFAAGSSSSANFIPGRLIIKPRAGFSDAALATHLSQRGANRRFPLRHQNIQIVTVPGDRADAVLAALRKDPEIEFAERDAFARAAFVPNDTYAASGAEWHLAKIQAPAAWDYSAGAPKIVVALLDSGINAAHPEFTGRILEGYNFVAGTTNCSDDFGHGTAVAGTLGAAGDNGVGVAGVAFQCSLLPVKVVNSSGFAAYSDIANGIYYAVDHGARIINISIAGDSPSAALQSAIDYAWSNNVVVVAAAGNTANDAPQYPGACNHVVAVSATEQNDGLAPFSSFGTDVSLCAPGDNIWTTQNDLSNPYGPWRGTSFASPIVCGVAALALGANPSLSNTQIVSLLASTTDDLGPPGYDVGFGHGRVNAFNCVAAAIVAAGGVMPAPPLTNSVPDSSPAAASVLAFPLFQKTSHYSGLIADTNGASVESSGYFALSVRPSGVFSGRIALEGRRYGLHGRFDSNGVASVSLPRPKTTPLSITLRLHPGAGVAEIDGGIISDTWTTELSADRNVFSARLNPAPQAGRRGFLLERSDDDTSAAAGLGKISKGGGARVHGNLADGRHFSAASTVGENGDYPFYLSLHHGSEIVIGWISFSSGQEPATAGTVLWLNSGTNTFARKLVAASAPIQ